MNILVSLRPESQIRLCSDCRARLFGERPLLLNILNNCQLQFGSFNVNLPRFTIQSDLIEINWQFNSSDPQWFYRRDNFISGSLGGGWPSPMGGIGRSWSSLGNLFSFQPPLSPLSSSSCLWSLPICLKATWFPRCLMRKGEYRIGKQMWITFDLRAGSMLS